MNEFLGFSKGQKIFYTQLLGIKILVLFWLMGPKTFARDLPRFPLLTKGRMIVDQTGKRVKLKAVNWYGSHLEDEVPGGLDKKSLDHIVGLIKKWGFNTVRLPFSNQMLHSDKPVPWENIAANPDLFGKNPLEIMDRVVEVLSAHSIMIVLNNHTTSSQWCCGFDHNALWFTQSGNFTQTFEQWQDDWLMLQERYKDQPWVVGADLRNEVRTGRTNGSVLPKIPRWGEGGDADWFEAATKVAQRLLEKRSTWLMVVEAVNWEGLIPLLGSGRRPQLRPMADLPLQLTTSRRLVYGVHTYGYTGPEHTGDERTSPGRKKYQDFDRDELFRLYDEEFGFILESGHFFQAPVWMSEFGVARGDDAPLVWGDHHQDRFLSKGSQGVEFSQADRQWFSALVEYLTQKDIDFAYWPLNPEGYGLLSHDWEQILDDDWRWDHLRKLLDTPENQHDGSAPTWTLLDLRRGDFRGDVDHARSETPIDWMPGASKAACRDHERLIGLSGNLRGLCRGEGHLSAQEQAMWTKDPWEFARDQAAIVAVNESYGHGHTAGDWASGMTKYECPLGSMVTGLAKHWWGLSGIRCQTPQDLKPLRCETLWFDREDNRQSTLGGDFARGSLKAQCDDHAYVAGVAHRDGTPGAILCCARF